MRKDDKIDAFTLTEILVVLVISAIVVGLAFSVLDLVQKNFRAIQTNYNYSTEVRNLQQQLTIDFNRFHNINFDPVLQEIHLKNSVDSVKYNFSENILVRITDTIPIPIKQLKLFFSGEEINDGKLDAVKILLDKSPDMFIFVSKHNSAKTHFE